MNPYGMSCAQCPAFFPIPGTNEGDPKHHGACRCNPPQPVVMQTRVALQNGRTETVNGAFPPTTADGFCWEIVRLLSTNEALKRASDAAMVGNTEQSVSN